MPQFLHGYVYVFSHACITVCGVNFHPVTVCFKFTLRSGVVLPPFKLSNRNRLSISQPSPGKNATLSGADSQLQNQALFFS